MTTKEKQTIIESNAAHDGWVLTQESEQPNPLKTPPYVGIAPLNDVVAVILQDDSQSTSPSGIAIVTETHGARCGLVFAVGEKVKAIKPQQKIIFAPSSGVSYHSQSKRTVFVHEKDVLAVVQ